MSNIQSAIEKRKAEGRKAFIPFITAGDPNIEATESFIYALEKAGSTVIELGIPFSDPVADGPVIQRANLRAMANGIHVGKVFDMIERVRKQTQIPLVFLMYANTIHYYGIDAFFERCRKVGVDGIIIPDVPLEERAEFNEAAKANGVDLIALVAPTSKERTKLICEDATGFLYCVSSLGVTGTRESIRTNLTEMFDEIKKYTKIPTALGFGISNKEQAESLKEYADGIIVGSAMVKIVEAYGANSSEKLYDFAKSIVDVL